ncbi:hypothetical protein ACCT15_16290 [Rhizobium ruizarguesonis]
MNSREDTAFRNVCRFHHDLDCLRKDLGFEGASDEHLKTLSDKPSKKLAHHQERHAVKDALKREEDIPASKAFGDPWNGDKDGKIWLGWEDSEDLRK